MRRRLYETLFAERCRRVRTLDGLPLARAGRGGKGGGGGVSRSRSAKGSGNKKDVVWAAMAEKGLIKVTKEEEEEEDDDDEEYACERWPAEDSFA